MKWISGVIAIIGLYFLSCKNSPDITQSTSPEAVGPSQAVDSMKTVAMGTNTAGTGNKSKTDTVPKIVNPVVDTFPKKNPNP